MSEVASPRHECLEHEGELRLRVSAPTLSGIFAEAGRALGVLSSRGRAIGRLGEWVPIVVEASDEAALLVDWMNALLWLEETSSSVVSEIEIAEVGRGRVSARVRTRRRPEPPTFIKAATLHGARVAALPQGFQADVVLDI